MSNTHDMPPRAALFDLALRMEQFDRPAKILDALHQITSCSLNINVLGGVRLPDQFGDVPAVVDGTSAFLHDSVPRGWWQEYLGHSRQHPSPVYAMAELCLRPFTTTESMQKLLPIGDDRWSLELLQKFGMRDVLLCPVGGRWVFAYWSADVMTSRIKPDSRAMLFLAANYAIMQFERLVGEEAKRLNRVVELTPREQAVLYALSRGARVADAAEDLGIGEETVRTHIKKAQSKLEARSQTAAVAKAIRQRLIP